MSRYIHNRATMLRLVQEYRAPSKWVFVEPYRTGHAKLRETRQLTSGPKLLLLKGKGSGGK